jgi:hypothetical protein
VVTLEEVFRKFGFGVFFGKFTEMFYKTLSVRETGDFMELIPQYSLPKDSVQLRK